MLWYPSLNDREFVDRFPQRQRSLLVYLEGLKCLFDSPNCFVFLYSRFTVGLNISITNSQYQTETTWVPYILCFATSAVLRDVIGTCHYRRYIGFEENNIYFKFWFV